MLNASGRRPRIRLEDAAAALLVVFSSATLSMVVAIVLLLRGDPRWADGAEIAVLVALIGVVLFAVERTLGDEEPPED
jgi:hypothetical protein